MNQKDPDAFVFSLTKGTKHYPYAMEDYTVRYHPRMYLLFGNDIKLDDNANKCSTNRCELGYCYKPSQGLEKNTPECNSWLSGTADAFNPSEIEIYLIEFL